MCHQLTPLLGNTQLERMYERSSVQYTLIVIKAESKYNKHYYKS